MRYVVFNRKGGVGKSTLVCNLATVGAARGRRTLVVDLDPQGNASHYLLGRDVGSVSPNLADFFEQTLEFHLLSSVGESDDDLHETAFENLWVLPASTRMAELEAKLEARHKIYKLRERLDGLADRFDDVWLDTPPAVGFFTLSALIAADRCLIPFDCDEFSRRAMYELMGTLREVQADHNPGLELGGVLVNQFQERARLPQEVVDELEAEGFPVLEPYVTASVKVRESHAAHRPLVEMAPSHKLAGQFRELWETVAG